MARRRVQKDSCTIEPSTIRIFSCSPRLTTLRRAPDLPDDSRLAPVTAARSGGPTQQNHQKTYIVSPGSILVGCDGEILSAGSQAVKNKVTPITQIVLISLISVLVFVLVHSQGVSGFGTLLGPDDPDVYPLLSTFQQDPSICFFDQSGTGDYSIGDPVYLVRAGDCTGQVNPNDLRLTEFSDEDAGSIVRSAHADRGFSLTGFQDIQIRAIHESQGTSLDPSDSVYLAFCSGSGCTVSVSVSTGWVRLTGFENLEPGSIVQNDDNDIGTQTDLLADSSEVPNGFRFWDFDGDAQFNRDDVAYWTGSGPASSPQAGHIRLGSHHVLGDFGQILQQDDHEVVNDPVSTIVHGGTICIFTQEEGPALLIPEGDCTNVNAKPGDYRLTNQHGPVGTYIQENDSDDGLELGSPSDIEFLYMDVNNNGILDEGDVVYLCAMQQNSACESTVSKNWIILSGDGNYEPGNLVDSTHVYYSYTASSLGDFSSSSADIRFWDKSQNQQFESGDILYLRTAGSSNHPLVNWLRLSDWSTNDGQPTQEPPSANELVADIVLVEKEGRMVTLDGSGSHHTGNRAIVSYSWSLGDGGEYHRDTVSWTYAEAGVYTVRLTVEDDQGQTRSVTQSITISEDGSQDSSPNPSPPPPVPQDPAPSEPIDPPSQTQRTGPESQDFSSQQGPINDGQQEVDEDNLWSLLASWFQLENGHVPWGWVWGGLVGVAALLGVGITLRTKSAQGHPVRFGSTPPLLEHKPSSPAIIAQGLTVSKKDKTILNGIDLEIPHNSLTMLIGQSGSGKSMLLKAFLGLEDSRGRLSVLGNEGNVKQSGTGVQVGYVPQKLQLYEEMTVEQNIRYFGENQNVPARTAKERIPDLLATLELQDKRKETVRNLSGGQQRRVSIACAMIHKPSILFMDEPSSGLDFTSRKNLCAMLQKLVAQTEVTVITTTHFLDETRYATNVGIVHEGKLAIFGDPVELTKSLPGRGRCVEIAFDHLGAREVDVLKKLLRGLKEQNKLEFYQIDGFIVRVTAPDPATASLGLPNLLNRNGLTPRSVQIDDARIEDVFLAFTGESYKEDRS